MSSKFNKTVSGRTFWTVFFVVFPVEFAGGDLIWPGQPCENFPQPQKPRAGTWTMQLGKGRTYHRRHNSYLFLCIFYVLAQAIWAEYDCHPTPAATARAGERSRALLRGEENPAEEASMLFLVAQVGWFADVLGGGNSNIFYFHPEPWGRFPIWRIFFNWVETTNYFFFWGGAGHFWHVFF